jgi:hypothetical protein
LRVSLALAATNRIFPHEGEMLPSTRRANAFARNWLLGPGDS